MNITAVIPCRAGSTRVPNKNFKSFADSSLLEIKVRQALKLDIPVVINSDSKIAEQVAIGNGVRFVKRPSYYASSACNNSEYYSYLGASVDTEYLMILQPTAPLLEDSTLLKAYVTFSEKTNEYDSLVTAQFAKKHAWFNNQPVNYELANTPNSQDLLPIVFPTFNVMIVKVDSLLQTKNAITKSCLFYEVSEEESIEIDTQLEFDIAEFLYKRRYDNK